MRALPTANRSMLVEVEASSCIVHRLITLDHTCSMQDVATRLTSWQGDSRLEEQDAEPAS